MRRNSRTLSPLFLMAVLVAGCGADSAKKHYVLAERLWSDGNYAAAVGEFEKSAAKDPHGKLGTQAILRAATTEAYFLSDYTNALTKFRTYASWVGDSPEAWDAQKQIGEILFNKIQKYDQALQHYQGLLKDKPASPDAAEFLFRVAKSHFFLMQFADAITEYQSVIKRFPGTPWAERSAYEIGLTLFTRGGHAPANSPGSGNESYQEAIEAYQKFLKAYPQSGLVSEARFGIATCLEEMDQLDAAYRAYEELRSTYPSPKVIDIKLARIRERKTQRSR